MMNDNQQPNYYSNKLGDSEFYLEENEKSKILIIKFDYNCDKSKIIWAQELFLMLPFIVHQERGKPLIISSSATASINSINLKCLCEYWQDNLPEKPLWNWSEQDINKFFSSIMIKKNPSEHHSSPVYATSHFSNFSILFKTSHVARVNGKISDGLSFPITTQLKYFIMQPILDEYGLTIEEWIKGQSHPPVPVDICAVILNSAINVLESEETAVALALYQSWRKTREFYPQWFPTRKCDLDIIQLSSLTNDDRFSLQEQIEFHHLGHLAKLPWKGRLEFQEFRNRLIGACLNIMFIQSGHRSHEFQSTVSNERKTKRGTLLVKQRLDKSLDGLKVYRPLAELSSRAAETLWNLSFVDPDLHPIPLYHSLHYPRFGEMVISNTLPPEALRSFDNFTLNGRLNAFYQSDVLPLIPEAQNIHPSLTTHQFRHSFTEFSLRRFDEDVHESLREHFVQRSEFSTQIYERWKLSPAVHSMLEKNYLYELIGKTADGKLDSRFWGPAFQRLKAEVDRIKFVSTETKEIEYLKILEKVARFAVFEWGFCVLFSSSVREAKCCDPITGIPDVDALATPGRCSGCPNNMGNSIQKNNLLRTELAYSEISTTHPVKAIRTLCADMAEKISRRTKD